MQKSVKIVVYHARQCDPKKCTALKLKRHGLIWLVPHVKLIPRRAVVLNPFSEIAFSPADRQRIEKFGLVALDCSWKHAEEILLKRLRGTSRCLPVLLAGNPVNFGKSTKLTTAEALAAALFIANFKEGASHLLSMFKWGHTFLDLNSERLEEYSKAKDSTEIIKMQSIFIEDKEKQAESRHAYRV